MQEFKQFKQGEIVIVHYLGKRHKGEYLYPMPVPKEGITLHRVDTSTGAGEVDVLDKNCFGLDEEIPDPPENFDLAFP